MAGIIIPRVACVLEERQRRLDDDLSHAEKIKDEAAAVIQAYEQVLADARTQAHTLLQEGQTEMNKLRQSHEYALAAQLASTIKHNEENIASAKTKALGKLKEIASEVTAVIVTQLTDLKLNTSSYQKIVGDIMKEFKQ